MLMWIRGFVLFHIITSGWTTVGQAARSTGWNVERSKKCAAGRCAAPLPVVHDEKRSEGDDAYISDVLHPSTELITDCRYGQFVIFKSDTYIGRSLRDFGEWSEREVSDVFRFYVKEGSVVLDIGANIGAFTVPFAKFAGRTGLVHAFEPVRVVHNLLVTNIVLNGLENVVPYRAMVGRTKIPKEEPVTAVTPVTSKEKLKKKKAEIKCELVSIENPFTVGETLPDGENNFGNGGVDQWTKVPDGTQDTAFAVDIDDFLAEGNLPRVDFIKIDTEGNEMAVVMGAKKTIDKYQPPIYGEVAFGEGMTDSKFVRYLWEIHKYYCFRHMVRLYPHGNSYREKNNSRKQRQRKNGEENNPHTNSGTQQNTNPPHRFWKLWSHNALCVSEKGLESLPESVNPNYRLGLARVERDNTYKKSNVATAAQKRTATQKSEGLPSPQPRLPLPSPFNFDTIIHHPLSVDEATNLASTGLIFQRGHKDSEWIFLLHPKHKLVEDDDNMDTIATTADRNPITTTANGNPTTTAKNARLHRRDLSKILLLPENKILANHHEILKDAHPTTDLVVAHPYHFERHAPKGVPEIVMSYFVRRRVFHELRHGIPPSLEAAWVGVTEYALKHKKRITPYIPVLEVEDIPKRMITVRGPNFTKTDITPVDFVSPTDLESKWEETGSEPPLYSTYASPLRIVKCKNGYSEDLALCP